MIKIFMCKNCGKLVNPETLICDACETDYNEKPNCEHLYNKFFFERNPINLTVEVSLKCSRCNGITTLIFDEGMFNDFISNIMRYV